MITPSDLLHGLQSTQLVSGNSICHNLGFTVSRYERVSWFPVLIAFLVALGVGGKNLFNAQPAEPASAATILSFASVIAGFVITYSAMASDFTMYYSPTVSR